MPPKQDKAAKKEKQKQETERLVALTRQIKSIYALDDMLAPLAAFKKYDRNGLNVRFEIVSVEKLSKEVFDWCFNLVKGNMQNWYEQTWGWSDAGKRSEMKESDALYLLGWDESSSDAPAADAAAAPTTKLPICMCHFRFEYDREKKQNVLYLYEIQTEEKYRNKGLGWWMMKILELLALKFEMSWLMLTVFEENKRAVQFYIDKLKYKIDETSPKPLDEEPHLILSKCFVRNP